MDTLDIPELLEIPDPHPYDENPVATADFLMTALLRKQPALLHAEFQGGDGRWFIRDPAQREACVAESKTVGEFRAVLGRFGNHMGGQLYGGYHRLSVTHQGRKFACEIFMSNQGRTGYWIRQDRAYGSRDASARGTRETHSAAGGSQSPWLPH